MKLSLNTQIAIGAVFGVLFGLTLNHLGPDYPTYPSILYSCDLIGGVFISLLKMILVPLIFTSITTGIANLRIHAQMQRVWKITMMYFIATTALASLLGLFVVNVFKPGVGLQISLFKDAMSSFNVQSITLPQFFQTFLSGLFVNPFAALAAGNILAIVIFSLFLGIALIVIDRKKENHILNFLNELFAVTMLIVSWIMRIAPLGIMALLIKLIATQNITLLSSLAKFIAIVMGATLFHGFVVLPAILFILTRTNIFKFFIGMREALITALSTSSSSATLPVTIRCVEDNLKVDKGIAGFVLPLGATINMDGTALYEAVAALFVANIVGAHLNFIQQLIVFFTSMIASIGAPGIPSAGMVTMVMVLQSVGLPAEAIAILLPIDRLLDTVRTMVNVEGDAIGSMVVQKYVA